MSGWELTGVVWWLQKRMDISYQSALVSCWMWSDRKYGSSFPPWAGKWPGTSLADLEESRSPEGNCKGWPGEGVWLSAGLSDPRTEWRYRQALTRLDVSRCQFPRGAKVDSDEFTLERKTNMSTLFSITSNGWKCSKHLGQYCFNFEPCRRLLETGIKCLSSILQVEGLLSLS